ncbi:hypothetical protein CHS0354_008338 [Potamilus streckersoni]|uniref:Cytochrome P450 n=1 Tax=Potamilus streckersoni TaxID=2493646 RepID=A0AAE0VUB5_9BIVA|nr:hypothetical protein CHS0354_008338 [Potamilus streckersoni]
MLARGKSLPGPHGWPILGCLLEVDPSRLHLSFDKWAKQYGPLLSCKMATKKLVVISCPRLVKKALTEKGSDVLNDRTETSFSKYVMDNAKGVIFGKYEPTTIQLKRHMKKGLKMHGQGVPQFETMAKKELDKLLKSVEDQRDRDFNPREFVAKYVANFVTILYSGSVLDETDAKVIWEYNDAIKVLLDASKDTMLLTFPFLRFLPTNIGRIYRSIMEAKEELLKKFFQSNKETYQPGQERGLVDALFKLQSEEKHDGEMQCLTDPQIKAIIQDVIFGGIGSVTNSILSILLILLRNHECVNKIYQEIVNVVGLDRYPSLQDRPAMPYTEAVILEALRYITPVPISAPHRAMEEVEFEGYTIPKDALIFMNIWTIHHDPSIWGDPWIFRPERFLNENGELLPVEHSLRQSLVIFGTGPRSCVGEGFAKSRIFLCLTTLVQKFDLLPPDVGTLISDDARTFLPGGVLRPADFNVRTVAR